MPNPTGRDSRATDLGLQITEQHEADGITLYELTRINPSYCGSIELNSFETPHGLKWFAALHDQQGNLIVETKLVGSLNALLHGLGRFTKA